MVEFDQPVVLARKGSEEREEWWQDAKRLQLDAFVCLISSTGRAIFFTVCDPKPKPPPKRRNDDNETDDDELVTRKTRHERPSLFRQAD